MNGFSKALGASSGELNLLALAEGPVITPPSSADLSGSARPQVGPWHLHSLLPATGVPGYKTHLAPQPGGQSSPQALHMAFSQTQQVS